MLIRKRIKEKHIKKVTIELYPHETTLIKKLQDEPSIQAYIKALIRADIEKENEFLDYIKKERWKNIEKMKYKINFDSDNFISNGDGTYTLTEKGRKHFLKRKLQ